MWVLAALLGCRGEAEDWTCMGPLVELVTWRNDVEADIRTGRRTDTPQALADEERAHVMAAVDTLAARRTTCGDAWRMVAWRGADTPASRLREEAVGILLDVAPRTYAPDALGRAGVPVRGR